MSVASVHKEAYIRKLREGTTIVAGEQPILLNSKQEFLQGAVPSTQSQRGFGWVKIHIYGKKTYSYVAEQQLFLKESGGNSFRYRNHTNHNSNVLFSLVDK